MTSSRRYLISYAIVAACVGFAICTFLFVAFKVLRSPEHSDILSEGYLVIGNVFLLTALVIVSLVYADSRRQKIKASARAEEKMSRVLQRLDSIYSTRTGLSAYLIRHSHEDTELESCVARSAEFLRFLVDETRIIFEDYTTQPCSVSVKLLVTSSGGKPEIKTYLRDKKSELKRQGIYPPNGLYPYTDHSPFVGIITGGEHDDFFLSNNLRADELRGLYRNGNPHWKKLYNATLIVPIREPDVVAGENILGFLCIDSMTAKFDQYSGVYLARIVAHTIFYVISALSQLEQRRTTTSKPRAADA